MQDSSKYDKFDQSRIYLNDVINELFTIVSAVCEDLFKSKYCPFYKYQYYKNTAEGLLTPKDGEYYIGVSFSFNEDTMEIDIYKTSGDKLNTPLYQFFINNFKKKDRDSIKSEIKTNILEQTKGKKK